MAGCVRPGVDGQARAAGIGQVVGRACWCAALFAVVSGEGGGGAVGWGLTQRGCNVCGGGLHPLFGRRHSDRLIGDSGAKLGHGGSHRLPGTACQVSLSHLGVGQGVRCGYGARWCLLC
ncbi:hypothetical protein CRENBAI_013566 [Crenichthys baileyi]|uniref:Secreted protein n=1 Tax=Crenichthys baileyi TaxID=28760 RepID=A0AAV9RLR3_9TELE